MRKIFTFGLISLIYSLGVYTSTVIAANNGDTFITDSVTKSTSIKDIAVKQVPDIIVYPNPASEFIKVEFNAPKSEKVSLDLIDMTGRSVAILFDAQVQGPYSNTFTLPALPNGKYFLKFSYGNQYIVKPIIVQR